jgi:hypothetical protein
MRIENIEAAILTLRIPMSVTDFELLDWYEKWNLREAVIIAV